MNNIIHVQTAGNIPQRRFQISMPYASKWQSERAERLMLELFSLSTFLNLAIVMQQEKIIWTITVPESATDIVRNAFYSVYPEVSVIDCRLSQLGDYQLYQFKLLEDVVIPLQFVTQFKNSDPLTTITTIARNLQKNEIVEYELTLAPMSASDKAGVQQRVEKSSISFFNYLSVTDAISNTVKENTGNNRTDRFDDAQLQKLANVKVTSSLKHATLSLKIMASPNRAEQLMKLVLPSFANFERSGMNELVPANHKGFPLVLCAAEAAALWHVPNEFHAPEHVDWSMTNAPIDSNMKANKDGVLLGTHTYRGESIEVRLPYKDRITHTYVIGRTRNGKSTLLHNMIHQDILEGKSVFLIDPHGDLVDDIIAKSIPPHREKDVIFLDVNDPEYAIGLNLMAIPKNMNVQEAAGSILGIVRKIFKNQWSATQMENVLYHALASLIEVGNCTILDISRLLTNPQFRSNIIAQISDPISLEFWQEFNQKSFQQQLQIAGPITNRIQKFYRDVILRQLVCQPDSLDFQEIMNEKKIFLANVNLKSETASETIGALLLSQIQMAAMSRTKDNRTACYLYVDEVQRFITTSLPTMFSESAKYGLNLCVANQFLSQLKGDTIDAIMGNVGTTIIFRPGLGDVTKLAPYVKPYFKDSDLENLSRFNAIIKTQLHGVTLPAFHVYTPLPVIAISNDDQRMSRIRDLSRLHYAKLRTEIDVWIKEHLNGDELSNLGDEEEENYHG